MAEPTKAELLHQEFEVKKEEVKDSIKGGIIEKYGGEEYLEAPPKQLIFAQTVSCFSLILSLIDKFILLNTFLNCQNVYFFRRTMLNIPDRGK